ncbi:MAG: hypothetical protein K2K92_04905 [Duncaniella sp.]|nr:hypothetical protein [Duncaniella sp.]
MRVVEMIIEKARVRKSMELYAAIELLDGQRDRDCVLSAMLCRDRDELLDGVIDEAVVDVVAMLSPYVSIVGRPEGEGEMLRIESMMAPEMEEVCYVMFYKAVAYSVLRRWVAITCVDGYVALTGVCEEHLGRCVDYISKMMGGKGVVTMLRL